jgi:hypothetical protein
MNRIAALIALLASGLAAGVAWGAAPPIVVGPSASMTTTSAATGTTTSASPTPTPTPTPVAPTSGASLQVSSAHAGARPVALTLKLHYEMQCGQPGSGSLVLSLPAAAKLSSSFTGTALLNGKRVSLKAGPGKTLRAALPAPPKVICDVIGPGTLTFVVPRTANVGNPAAPGSYPVTARAGIHAFRTTLQITA